MRESFSLLYHSGDAREVSPFDKAIVRIARDASIRVAAPFIGLRYLERVIDLAADWRLLSDVEAWIKATPGRLRWETWTFIRENIESIRHVRALHAKVVVSHQGGYVGSANLTPAGILGKTELGVFIESPAHCRELEEWFDQLWSDAQPPEIDETSEIIRLAEKAAATTPRTPMLRLSSASRAVRASLAQEGGRLLARAKSGQDTLTETVLRAAIDDYEAYKSVADLAQVFMQRTLAGTASLTLRDVVTMVRTRHPEATVREVHDAVALACANHFSTVFLAENQDVAVIEPEGALRECTPERLIAAVHPFDIVLSAILEVLAFTEFRRLPPEETLAEASKLPVAWIDFLVAALVEFGLLLEHDVAGAAIEYQLEPLFDWPVRWNRYRQASALWQLHAAERGKALGATKTPVPEEATAVPKKGKYELRYGRLVERRPVMQELEEATEQLAGRVPRGPELPPAVLPEPADWRRDMALARAIELLSSSLEPLAVETLAPKMARAGEFTQEDAVDVLATAIRNGMLQAIEREGVIAVGCNWTYRPLASYKQYPGTMIAWGMFAERSGQRGNR